MGPNDVTDVLIRIERVGDTQRHREEGHMMVEAEIGVMWLQAKECQGLPATSRSGWGKDGFFPRASRRSVPWGYLSMNLWPPELLENKFLFFLTTQFVVFFMATLPKHITPSHSATQKPTSSCTLTPNLFSSMTTRDAEVYPDQLLWESPSHWAHGNWTFERSSEGDVTVFSHLLWLSSLFPSSLSYPLHLRKKNF